MKTSAIVLGLLLSAILVRGQADTTISFEAFSTLVQIDTSNADNIWQIGIPDKVVFDSAYSVPNAIVTDTVAFYPTDNHSKFTVEFYLDVTTTVTIWFRHKLNSQESQDGGYVDISCDNGNNWQHLYYEGNGQNLDSTFSNSYVLSNLYFDTDTIFNGKPAFLGEMNEWMSTYITFPCMVAKTGSDCLMRFNFESDSVESQHEGWLIDDIEIQYSVCSAIEEFPNNDVFISPNPIDDKTVFQLLDGLQIRNGTLMVFDTFGRTIDTQQKLNGNRLEYDASGLKSGVYLFRLVDEERFSSSGKFIVK